MLKKSLVTCFFGACAILPIAPVAANPSCFEIGLTGGWFKVSPTSRTYGVARTDASGAAVQPNGSIIDINPKWRFGGGGYLNYTPCGQPYAWGISYFAVNNSKTSTTNGRVGIAVGNPNGAIQEATGGATASLKTRYQYGTIYLQTTHAACCDVVHIKPRLGIAYLNLRHHNGVQYSTVGGVVGQSFSVNESSKYQGWGPVIGTDLKYCFCGDFSLFGNFEYAAFLGKLRGNIHTVSTNLAQTARNVSFGGDSANTVVSQIQSEIGVGYCFNFWCFDRGNIALGWRFSKIFDVSRRLEFVDDVNPNRVVSVYRNVNLQGPFIRLAFGF